VFPRDFFTVAGRTTAFLAHNTSTLFFEQLVRANEAREFQTGRVNGARMLDERLGTFPTLVHQQLKYLRYAELKALDWQARARPTRAWEWPLVFVATFVKDYVFRLAALDGTRGFVAAWLAAEYALYKRMRYYEMVSFPDSVALAHAVLRAHRLER